MCRTTLSSAGAGRDAARGAGVFALEDDVLVNLIANDVDPAAARDLADPCDQFGAEYRAAGISGRIDDHRFGAGRNQSRDLVGSVTRPVCELKGFQKIDLQPGESRTVSFKLRPADLTFVGLENKWIVEPGAFKVGVANWAPDR